MRVILVLNIIILILLATAQTTLAPRGAWFSKIRIIETEAGTRTEMVRYWREVKW